MRAPLATQADYRTYALDDGAEVDGLTLRRASNVVRAALVGFTHYLTDDAGLPTDDRVRAVLTEAVCAQVDYWDATGEDGTGADEGLTSSSILGVSYSREPGAAGSTRSLCAEAHEVLLVGGMFSPSVAY